jgi:Lrp/AsnC family transcriptional regulator, regulator of ectoine-degradation genes
MPDVNPRTQLGLDTYDLQILATLQRDGRMAKIKLAETIGLSPTASGTRIERLEKMGLIVGYHADIDLVQLTGLSRFRMMISIRNWTPPKGRRFEAALMKIPNIVECEAVLGNIDYSLTILALSVTHYQELIGRILEALPDDIDYTTYPVSRTIKREVDIALLKLEN